MSSERSVAIDIGSGLTKGTDGMKRELIPSVAVRGRLDGRYGLDRATPISWRNGEWWLVGEDAIAFGDPHNYAATLTKEWAASDGWQALLYAMLGRLDASGSVNLVTGVPMAWYQELAAPMRQRLTGVHRFRYGQRALEIDIKPDVFPQAVAALYFHAGQMQSLPNKLGVIEIGTYTTGLSVVYRERPVVNQCGGIAVGTSVLAAQLAEYLKREHHFATDVLAYHEILQACAFEVRGRKLSIKPVLRELALLAGKPLLDAIEGLWPNRDEMVVYVGGGGAELFLPAIRHLIPHAQRMDGGVFAVVEGMYLLAALQHG